jgi:hypothetical protein
VRRATIVGIATGALFAFVLGGVRAGAQTTNHRGDDLNRAVSDNVDHCGRGDDSSSDAGESRDHRRAGQPAGFILPRDELGE